MSTYFLNLKNNPSENLQNKIKNKKIKKYNYKSFPE